MTGNKTIFLLLLSIIFIAWFASALSKSISLQNADNARIMQEEK